ncbi:hypothetical protein FJT64_009747 [Amphibalanus amphitrite]|uniref:Retrotransposon gag domain-containing protein n=1 Tax=Amphibalanus amphitrite TaxID=1232801 RepID=A0A6A4VFA3_AMPAM|nr:hypothetical protein FJT64_009747 [Amphibalanus amphitrite]
MNVEGVSPPTPFLARPGKPALPWSDWIFSFHNYLTALGGEAYSTERKTALLLHCVGAEAQRVYRTLPVQPRREDEDEFHAAERRLAEFYEPQVNVISERFFFRQRRQESHEPTADYVAALRRLAVNCSFGQMTDAMIRDQVVEATVHPILRERFLQDKGLTLDRVLEIAEAFERSRREATAMAGPARPAADGAQMPVPAEEADLHEDSSAEEEVIALLTDEESVLTEQDVRTASAADPELQQLRHQIKRGWPSSAKACPVEVQPYFKIRHELWVRNDDVILRGAQQEVIDKWLFLYRVTPHATTGETPGQLLLGYKPITRLDKLKPDIEGKVRQNQLAQVQGHRRKCPTKRQPFEIGQLVWARQYGRHAPLWATAVVKKCLHPLYWVVLNGQMQKRHMNQLCAQDVTAPEPEVTAPEPEMAADRRTVDLALMPAPLQRPLNPAAADGDGECSPSRQTSLRCAAPSAAGASECSADESAGDAALAASAGRRSPAAAVGRPSTGDAGECVSTGSDTLEHAPRQAPENPEQSRRYPVRERRPVQLYPA